jgi:hypothetical protein
MKTTTEINHRRLLLAASLVILFGSTMACLGIAASMDRSTSLSVSTAAAQAMPQKASSQLPAPEQATVRQEPPATQAPAAIPSASPIVTTTHLPTLTPTPSLHPMMIAALRQTDYPGSDIILIERLEPGSNYDRFYASYESEA